MFSKEELNALGVIVSQATISGKDAKFIVNLLEKIEKELNEKTDVSSVSTD